MPTHHQGRPDERQALDCYIKLMRAAGSASSRQQKLIAGHRLSESQFGVLEALYHLGPLNQTELCRKILKTSGNITLVIDNLEKRALARRERNPADRRSVHVHLTEKGRRLIREIFPQHVAAIVEEMSVLTAAEQEELGRLCKKLGLREDC